MLRIVKHPKGWEHSLEAYEQIRLGHMIYHGRTSG